MKDTIKKAINQALKGLFELQGIDFVVEDTKELSHGDMASNVALIVGKKIDKSPKEVAESIVEFLQKQNMKDIENISVAGAGFINFKFSKEFFIGQLSSISRTPDEWGGNTLLKGKKIMIEYTDPNPFKPFHIGHLMTNAIGESIARLTENSGATIFRANYQGDVGLHVAKAIWGQLHVKNLGSLTIHFNGDVSTGVNVTIPVEQSTLKDKAQYIGYCYYIGSEAYEHNKAEINEINKKIYDKSDENINALYKWGREVTLEAFEEIYKILGTKFNYYFFESEVAPKGLDLVKEYLHKDIFEESEGAVVFKAEKYNPKLHTRVFINSQGLPTYETKELGLTKTKFEKENSDLSVVITAVEQKDYMAVATEAMRQIDSSLANRMKHITHGMMRFASGKMSSRKGNVITGESLIRDTIVLVEEKMKDPEKSISEIIAIGAIKFVILRQGIGGDIVYDENQALSFEGDSGPYLQYSAVRAKSILEKAKGMGIDAKLSDTKEISDLEKIILRFPNIVERATLEWAPHHVVGYLLDLAQAFNSWYANTQIIDKDNPDTPHNLAITKSVYQTIKNGLWLLGINTPSKM